MRMLQALVASFALLLPLAAQPFFSGTFNQNPVPLGTIAILNFSATEPITLSNGCGYVAIRAGSPTGPIVQAPFICPLILITVGPGASRSFRWDGRDGTGALVAPGTYYIEVGGFTGTGISVSGFFPLRIDPASGPVEPVLSASVIGSALPQIPSATGGQFDLQVSAPADPFALCIAAASFTTNVGQSVPPLFIGLDADVVFGLSFPTPLPGIFLNFQTTLDAAGTANMALVVPPSALPVGTPLAVQAVIFGVGGPGVTNVASLQII